jgi:galactose mutarotase-like enzyme
MTVVALEAGGDRCVVDPAAGGRLASLVAGGRERLLGREAGHDGAVPPVMGWGSFLMAPWVGRLDHGRLPWQGRTYELPPDFGPHALHGTVKDRAWEVEAEGRGSVTLTCPLEDPWPFGGLVRQTVTLTPGRLDLVAEVEAGAEPMPAGIGWHPWFARPADGDVAVPLAVTDDLIPTGAVNALDRVTDLRHGPALGARLLDHVYVGVGDSARIAWPDLRLRQEWEAPVNSACVHSPPRGFCVEPQTQWPNAAALAAGGAHGTGQATAAPGVPLRARTTWTWSPA